MLLVPLLYLVWFSHNKNGEPEKADLSHMVKFLSDDGNVFLFYLRSGIMSLSKMC